MADRLFVYGTLAPGRANEHVLASITGEWEPATVRGTLFPRAWGAASGYPGIVLDEREGEVNGFLLTSPRLPAHWARIDAFEGEGYQRAPVEVTRGDGSTVRAFVYELSENGRGGHPHTRGGQ